MLSKFIWRVPRCDPCADGRYIYFVGQISGTGLHAEMMRYDTMSPFQNADSWEVFDACANGVTDELGFCECVSDGQYVYFGPGDYTTRSAEVLRFESGSQAVPTVSGWGTVIMLLLVLSVGR